MKKFSITQLILTGLLCLALGAGIGASVVAKSKAGQIADIVAARDKQLRELEEKHAEEIRTAYAAIKAKASGMLESVDENALGATLQDETQSTIEEAGSTVRNALENLRKKYGADE